VRTLILSAGHGMRLRPLTYVRAKAAVPVNGAPIVRRVVSWLVRERFTDLVINLHHRPASIAALIGDGADLGARVRYSWENPVLGSGGGPRRALSLLVDDHQDGPFLMINGDTLTDLPLATVVERHSTSGALVTMVLTRNPRPDIYGGVLVKDGYVTGFSRPGAVRESFHFIGVQIAEARAYRQLDDGVPAESVMGLYPRLMQQDRRAIVAQVVEAPFQDIGTPADYLQTSLELAAAEGSRMIGANARIDDTADVRDTAIWDNVTIHRDTHLDGCIVCDDVEIPAGARYRRCAIVPAGAGDPLPGARIDGQLLVTPF
jgi:mannose-1-phosphate guanylyltransferase / phosphomannomutase